MVCSRSASKNSSTALSSIFKEALQPESNLAQNVLPVQGVQLLDSMIESRKTPRKTQVWGTLSKVCTSKNWTTVFRCLSDHRCHQLTFDDPHNIVHVEFSQHSEEIILGTLLGFISPGKIKEKKRKQERSIVSRVVTELLNSRTSSPSAMVQLRITWVKEKFST